MTAKEVSRRRLFLGLTGAALGAALPKVLAGEESSPDVVRERQYDVVVAGAGGAGCDQSNV